MGRSWSRSRLGLKIRCLGLVSVSSRSRTIGSHLQAQYSQLVASLQNCTYIVLNARHLYCLLIHKSKRLTVCTTQDVGRQQSILQQCSMLSSCPMFTKSVTVSVPLSKMGVVFYQVWSESQWTVLLRYLINTLLSQQMLDAIKHVVDNSVVFQQDTCTSV